MVVAVDPSKELIRVPVERGREEERKRRREEGREREGKRKKEEEQNHFSIASDHSTFQCTKHSAEEMEKKRRKQQRKQQHAPDACPLLNTSMVAMLDAATGVVPPLPTLITI